MEPVELPDSANQEEEEEQMGRDEESDAPLIPGKSSATQIADFYDLLLSKLGVTFKLLLIVFCSGIGLLSDTLEIMSISFAKDDISKQFKLSRLEESTLAGVLFAGMLLGGLVWGRAADIYGRRRILLISLSMNGTCAALSALSTSFSMFLLARFFSGIGWTAWRVYLLLCSIPSLLAVLLYFFLSESPVFLIQKGRNLQALEALRRFAPNSSDISQELGQLKRVLEDENMVTSASERLECHAVIKEFAMGVVELFSGGLLKITLILIAVILPVHFGYYGFMLWFPEYIKKQSNSSGEILSEDYVYRESLYVSLASLPGNLISVLLTDVVGPKLILCVSQVLSACSVFLLWKFNSPDQTVLLTCLFNAVTAPIFNMVDVLIPALYPTQSRGTAFGFHCALIRIVTIAGTSLFSMFIDSSPTAPILLTAILLFSSALVSLAVPKITSISH
ncbi:hypothetical protein ACHWQZ_G010842 [Mnemiopsis leidyi]